MSSLSINKNVFFLFAGRELAAWNFKDHEQYVLRQEHVEVLLAISAATQIEDSKFLKELLESKLVLKTSEVAQEAEWDWDPLARIFHVGTSFPYAPFPEEEAEASSRSRQYTERCEEISVDMPIDAFTYQREGRIHTLLPAPQDCGMQLLEVLQNRITTRNFADTSISISSVSAVLRETFGYRDHLHQKFSEKGLETPTRRRSSPSGGSLQCSEAYLVARNVSGLPSGIYHYQSHANSISLIDPIAPTIKFGTEYLAGQSFSDDPDAFLVITSRLNKMWWKYHHSRAYRVACLDVGHRSQTAQLVATGLGLRTRLTAAFYDDKIRSLLKIEPEIPEYPMLVLGFGSGDVDPVDKHYLPETASE